MGLTKKHFRAIAQAIKDSTTKEELVNKLIVIMKADNGRFDEDKFREAIKDNVMCKMCGRSEGQKPCQYCA